MSEMTFTCECGQEDPAYGETYKRRLCQDCLKEFVAKLEAEIERLRAEKDRAIADWWGAQNQSDSVWKKRYEDAMSSRNTSVRQTFLDAAKMADKREEEYTNAAASLAMFKFALDLRRAAEGVKHGE